MLTNVILGSNDLERSATFYDGLLALFDARQVMRNERSILWKGPDDGVGLAVCSPYDGQPASHGNGSMVGLRAHSIDDVARIHGTALRLGGRCEGPPGERRPGVHAAYFRDPDGNKFGVFHIAAAT